MMMMMLQVRENKISLHRSSVGNAHLRTFEGTLPLGVVTVRLKTAGIEH